MIKGHFYNIIFRNIWGGSDLLEKREFEEAKLKAQEILEKEDADLRVRKFQPKMESLVMLLIVIWTAFQLYYNTIGALDAITLRALHAMFLVLFTFLLYPSYKSEKRQRKIPPIWDMALIVLEIFLFAFIVINYKKIAMAGGYLTSRELIVAGLVILVVLEAGRRTSKNLAILAIVFLTYNYWGKFIPGALGHTGLGLRRILGHMVWGSQGIFGVGIGVSATYIFLFVLFGAFLKHSGFSNFINDLALAIVGKSPGGPAKVAVIASALLGMINGSAIANVATTGTITIPMMKKTGYSSEFSGAVEAVASTGGQFCPPIMGAVGFVMAEFLGITYTKVMVAATLPAFLYYFGIMISVHLEAKRLGLKGISVENIPNAIEVIKKQGYLALPLVVLLAMMFLGYTPIYSAVVATFSTVISANLKKETRMDLRKILVAIEEGAKSAISVGVSCVLIGLIIGTVSLTGLGLNFGNLILRIVGDGQLLLGGFMVMIMSVILGMGVPGVAAYVIVVAVAVPVLVNVGALPIAAHMFCLIYACLSNITPPVAMSSYVAAGIAKSDMTKTSLIAVKLGITGFLIPFFFLNNPVLLLGAAEGISTMIIIRSVATAIIGVFCISAGFEGMLLKPCNYIMRALLIISGLLAIHPGIVTDLLGICVIISILLIQKSSIKKEFV